MGGVVSTSDREANTFIKKLLFLLLLWIWGGGLGVRVVVVVVVVAMVVELVVEGLEEEEGRGFTSGTPMV
jgi:uncharacterized membrane protein